MSYLLPKIYYLGRYGAVLPPVARNMLLKAFEQRAYLKD